MSSASDGHFQPVSVHLRCLIDCGCRGIFKMHASWPGTKRDPHKHRCCKYSWVWRDWGEAVYTERGRQISAGLGLKMKHEWATVCCRPPLNRITYCATYSLHKKRYVSERSRSQAACSWYSSRNDDSLFTINCRMFSTIYLESKGAEGDKTVAN